MEDNYNKKSNKKDYVDNNNKKTDYKPFEKPKEINFKIKH
jgi:hypothetical protein